MHYSMQVKHLQALNNLPLLLNKLYELNTVNYINCYLVKDAYIMQA